MVYAVACILITIIPVISYDNCKVKTIFANDRSKKFVYLTLCIFSFMAVEPFIENIVHLRSVINNMNVVADIYTERADGDGAKFEYLSWIGRKFFWILFLLRDIIPLLLFYYIIKWKKHNKYVIIGTVLAILNPIIHSLNLGGRSTVIQTAFYFIFVYMLFRPYMLKKMTRSIDKTLLLLSGVTVLGMAAITIARFSSRDFTIDIWTWVTLYTGEGILNFSSDLWPLSQTCNGDNTFLMVRYILGLTNNIGIEQVRATRDVLGVRNMVFYTYLGTIYYDFNKIGTILYCAVFSWLFYISSQSRKGVFKLSQLGTLAILGKVIMMGVMFYPYTLWTDQLSLLFLLIYIMLLKTKEKGIRLL